MTAQFFLEVYIQSSGLSVSVIFFLVILDQIWKASCAVARDTILNFMLEFRVKM